MIDRFWKKRTARFRSVGHRGLAHLRCGQRGRLTGERFRPSRKASSKFHKAEELFDFCCADRQSICERFTKPFSKTCLVHPRASLDQLAIKILNRWKIHTPMDKQKNICVFATRILYTWPVRWYRRRLPWIDQLLFEDIAWLCACRAVCLTSSVK